MESISDSDVIAAVSALSDPSFDIVSVEARHGELSLAFLVRGSDELFGIRLPLPSSTAANPFVYAPPNDAKDWAGQLSIFLAEQSETRCSVWAAREIVDGIPFFILERYGFRQSDQAEHLRLMSLTEKHG